LELVMALTKVMALVLKLSAVVLEQGLALRMALHWVMVMAFAMDEARVMA